MLNNAHAAAGALHDAPAWHVFAASYTACACSVSCVWLLYVLPLPFWKAAAAGHAGLQTLGAPPHTPVGIA